MAPGRARKEKEGESVRRIRPTSVKMQNYIHGQWRDSAACERLPVVNPATGEDLGRVPLSPACEVDEAARSGAQAFRGWRRTPVTERVQYLFRLKGLLEENFEDLARTITRECGKTIAESRGEMRRAIENVEVACGAPVLVQGYCSEDVASGIDETLLRQPLGVCTWATWASTSGWRPPWRSFLSAARARASMATCMARAATPSSSSPGKR
jgi:malonate-semialdehyde dehydrogenase (acetylating) / methylmalonate-semialdehyde dehydrogenase